MRKNFQILHDTLPVIFTDKKRGNKPLLFRHKAQPGREGLRITDEELTDFGLDLLEDFYSKQLMSVTRGKVRDQNYLLLEDKESRRLYIAVKVARYFMNPLNIDESGCEGVIELAETNNSEVVLAPLAFAFFSNTKSSIKDMFVRDEAVAGGLYFCAYRGLMAFGTY